MIRITNPKRSTTWRTLTLKSGKDITLKIGESKEIPDDEFTAQMSAMSDRGILAVTPIVEGKAPPARGETRDDGKIEIHQIVPDAEGDDSGTERKSKKKETRK